MAESEWGMDSTQPIPAIPPPVSPAQTAATRRRNAVTIKLLFIAGLVLLLQLPLRFVSELREERASNHGLPKTPVEVRVEEAEENTVPTISAVEQTGGKKGGLSHDLPGPEI